MRPVVEGERIALPAGDAILDAERPAQRREDRLR